MNRKISCATGRQEMKWWTTSCPQQSRELSRRAAAAVRCSSGTWWRPVHSGTQLLRLISLLRLSVTASSVSEEDSLLPLQAAKNKANNKSKRVNKVVRFICLKLHMIVCKFLWKIEIHIGEVTNTHMFRQHIVQHSSYLSNICIDIVSAWSGFGITLYCSKSRKFGHD